MMNDLSLHENQERENNSNPSLINILSYISRQRSKWLYFQVQKKDSNNSVLYKTERRIKKIVKIEIDVERQILMVTS